MCGEAWLPCVTAAHHQGPSPRVRGSRLERFAGLLRQGSIPACAGKPTSASGPSSSPTVHPRVCGEARAPVDLGGRFDGSIPACAGKPFSDFAMMAASRVHPTRVPGKPTRRPPTSLSIRVHPRVCGEAGAGAGSDSGGLGPSPRVRGSPSGGAAAGAVSGSIPACAGKPGLAQRMHDSRMGPSPRVRGSPVLTPNDHPFSGSIPACAGKPVYRSDASSLITVHPRVCGEAGIVAPSCSSITGPSPRVREAGAEWLQALGLAGPSPRVRGSHSATSASSGSPRSIPRVCGEAHDQCAWRRVVEGSIPACAGKPRWC